MRGLLAGLAVLCACAPSLPPETQLVGPVPEVQSIGEGMQDVAIHVSAPGDLAELRGHLERAFLKAGFRVMKTPPEASHIVSVADAGGSYSKAGMRDGYSFSETSRNVVATITVDGRQFHEVKVESSFKVAHEMKKRDETTTKQLSEQSTASWQLIANTIVNGLIEKLSTDTPVGESASIR